ncbi:lipopolysaccharide biosynthesis protein [Curtanaerobium respiraculi]|uniref:lipopolysaccharide biosynthesis protein n=1 Tax=Curtanaerobium respiraculi TaxID=2949669 RepID=UPI0024B3BD3C|nr:lipopolysaccharide biosynthesis protein [Curtanaerobium respiraculi]
MQLKRRRHNEDGPAQQGGYVPLGDDPRMQKEQFRQYNSADPEPDTRSARLRSRLLGLKRNSSKPRKKSALTKAIEAWTARLLGAARADGSFAAQEAEYESNRTSQDYLWNTTGLATWGMVFPLLTIIVTQLVGVERAGMFSFAFVVANLLMILANYGARTYQVSDRDEAHAFSDYQINRWLTVILMLVVGYLFCTFHGYAGEMFTMTMWLFVYRAVDGLADCYEGRLQQVDKLYLAGISQTIRSALAFLVFSFFLLVTRDLGIASIAMGVVAALTFAFITLPLTLLETPQSARFSLASVGRIFAACFPAFVALFLYAVIDNMPKFMMESVLSYDNQLYFNALYFPAQAILLIVGFCYKPMLTRMADAWNDLGRRRRFDLLIFVALLAVAGITLAVLFLMATIGLPIMSFLYGIDFEQFRHISYLMVIAGGITGGIDFLYQVFTVMRRQWAVTKLYVITVAFALAICYMLIHVSELRGAVMSYLITMAILLVLLVLEYIRIRVEYKRHPEDDPTLKAAKARAAAQQERPDDPQSAGEAPAPSDENAHADAPPARVARDAGNRAASNVRSVEREAAGRTPTTSTRNPRDTAEAPEGAPSARVQAMRRVPIAYSQQPAREETAPSEPEGASHPPAAPASERPPLEFTPREIARQERIVREGGEPDPRYRAWRALQQRRQNREQGK